MKFSHLLHFAAFGISTILFRRKKAILGTIIVTDKCNLKCKHCSVHDKNCTFYPYADIRREMETLFQMGIKILFFSGGETFMWTDEGKTIRDLVKEAKAMGFYIVNAVTNGTYPIDLPDADIILLSLDGQKEIHDIIRGETFNTILQNVRNATAKNLCIYMAINQINKGEIEKVAAIAGREENIKAVSFNFHTPYPDTEELELSLQNKEICAETIKRLIKEKYPVFNVKSALPYIVKSNFKPCRQCVVMEKGEMSDCGRCIHIDGLCKKCGYFFVAEYSLIFQGKWRVIFEMLKTYPKYF